MTNDRNKKYVCSTCGGKYTRQNKATHKKTKKHISAVLDSDVFDKKLVEFEHAITVFLELIKNGDIVL
jgi:hypothetical protein